MLAVRETHAEITGGIAVLCKYRFPIPNDITFREEIGPTFLRVPRVPECIENLNLQYILQKESSHRILSSGPVVDGGW